MRSQGRRTDEKGSALIIAVLVMMVATTLSTAALANALHSISSTKVDRNRVQAVAAADAGIDSALSVLQGATTLPCAVGAGTPVLTVPVASTPIAASAAVQITYYSTWPPGAQADTNCSNGIMTDTPQAAEILSTGTVGATSVGHRVMDAMVHLVPSTPSGTLTDAIFAQNTFSFANNFQLNGQTGEGDNANVYVGGTSASSSVSCPNGVASQGGLYLSQGSISLSNSCHVYGSVWANASVTASNSVEIDGTVTSSTGDITFSNSAYAASAVAAGSIYPSCPSSKNFGACVTKANPGPVPTQTFPQINYVASAWAAAGFTNIDTNNNCTSAPLLQTTVYQDIAAMSNSTVKTVIITNCQLNYSNQNSLTAKADLAIFTSGGINVANNFSWSSGDSTTHNLYLIAPYSSTGCPAGSFNFSNQTQFNSMNVMMYTPCSIQAANKTNFTGQLYAGNGVSIANAYTMTFQPMSVPGATGTGSVQQPSYNAAVDYERETSG